MPRIKLSYFDFQGGRGEVARIALTIAGIPFEDDRIRFPDWASRKPSTPFAALPVLEVDGRVVSQSNAINRYVGKLAELYPTDPWEAALCDEAMDAIEDIGVQIQHTFALSEDAKLTERQKLVDGPLSFYLSRLAQQLNERGGKYFAGDGLTVADLKVFLWIRYLRSGTLDHVPRDLPDRVAPGLVAHYERVRSLPGVAAYYARLAGDKGGA